MSNVNIFQNSKRCTRDEVCKKETLMFKHNEKLEITYKDHWKLLKIIFYEYFEWFP